MMTISLWAFVEAICIAKFDGLVGDGTEGTRTPDIRPIISRMESHGPTCFCEQRKYGQDWYGLAAVSPITCAVVR